MSWQWGAPSVNTSWQHADRMPSASQMLYVCLTLWRHMQLVAHGSGKHLGSGIQWSFMWRRDGAFYEEVRSRHLTFRWGYDGGEQSTCWEVSLQSQQ